MYNKNKKGDIMRKIRKRQLKKINKSTLETIKYLYRSLDKKSSTYINDMFQLMDSRHYQNVYSVFNHACLILQKYDK